MAGVVGETRLRANRAVAAHVEPCFATVALKRVTPAPTGRVGLADQREVAARSRRRVPGCRLFRPRRAQLEHHRLLLGEHVWLAARRTRGAPAAHFGDGSPTLTRRRGCGEIHRWCWAPENRPYIAAAARRWRRHASNPSSPTPLCSAARRRTPNRRCAGSLRPARFAGVTRERRCNRRDDDSGGSAAPAHLPASPPCRLVVARAGPADPRSGYRHFQPATRRGAPAARDGAPGAIRRFGAARRQCSRWCQSWSAAARVERRRGLRAAGRPAGARAAAVRGPAAAGEPLLPCGACSYA